MKIRVDRIVAVLKIVQTRRAAMAAATLCVSIGIYLAWAGIHSGAMVMAGAVFALWLADSIMVRLDTQRVDLERRIVRLAESQKRELDNLYAQLEALISITADERYKAGVPKMRGWAVSPDCVRLILEQIWSRSGPVTVMELGSGSSTLVIAQALSRRGSGHVYSIDHDAGYAEETRQRLALHGLSGYATVVLAPLREQKINGENLIWYDARCIPEKKLDILFVDGPPAHDLLSRYPAVPYFQPMMKPRSVIILDDAAREVERAMVERWRSQGYICDEKHVDTEKGAIILKVMSI